MAYNAPCTGEKYRAIAKAMGEHMTQGEYRKAVVDAVRKLAADVGVPATFQGILREEDVQFLSESAFEDAFRPGNPRDTSVEETAKLYRSLLPRRGKSYSFASPGPDTRLSGHLFCEICALIDKTELAFVYLCERR